MSGLEISFAVGAVVALGGVAIVLAWLPSRASISRQMSTPEQVASRHGNDAAPQDLSAMRTR
jgi:hypothetical protein